MFKPKQWNQRQFTEGLRKEIKNAGLIETGTLYGSIDISVTIDDNGVMTLDIYAVEYLKYLWFGYNLENFVYKGAYLWTAYAQWLDYMTKKYPSLNWKQPTPKVKFNLIDL